MDTDKTRRSCDDSGGSYPFLGDALKALRTAGRRGSRPTSGESPDGQLSLISPNPQFAPNSVRGGCGPLPHKAQTTEVARVGRRLYAHWETARRSGPSVASFVGGGERSGGTMSAGPFHISHAPTRLSQDCRASCRQQPAGSAARAIIARARRLAGRGQDNARAREALAELGLNPLMVEAFRDQANQS